jgi:hypothetical protein
VTVQPTLEFSHQPGSLSLEVSVRTPRNPNVEGQRWQWLQVNIHHQLFDGLLFHHCFPLLFLNGSRFSIEMLM